MKTLKLLPNLLSFTRILLCPFILSCLISQKFALALGLFIASVSTDMLDGFIARRFGAASTLGSYLDPIADKLTILGCYTALMFLGLCPAWYVGLYIAVVLLLSVGLLFFHSPNAENSHFSPLWIGKWNTALQLSWVGYLIFIMVINKGVISNFLSIANPIVFTFLCTLQVGVFLGYFFHYRVHLTPEARTFFPIHSSR